jgi:hypothetical protein
MENLPDDKKEELEAALEQAGLTMPETPIYYSRGYDGDETRGTWNADVYMGRGDDGRIDRHAHAEEGVVDPRSERKELALRLDDRLEQLARRRDWKRSRESCRAIPSSRRSTYPTRQQSTL